MCNVKLFVQTDEAGKFMEGPSAVQEVRRARKSQGVQQRACERREQGPHHWSRSMRIESRY